MLIAVSINVNEKRKDFWMVHLSVLGPWRSTGQRQRLSFQPRSCSWIETGCHAGSPAHTPPLCSGLAASTRGMWMDCLQSSPHCTKRISFFCVDIGKWNKNGLSFLLTTGSASLFSFFHLHIQHFLITVFTTLRNSKNDELFLVWISGGRYHGFLECLFAVRYCIPRLP